MQESVWYNGDFNLIGILGEINNRFVYETYLPTLGAQIAIVYLAVAHSQLCECGWECLGEL